MMLPTASSIPSGARATGGCRSARQPDGDAACDRCRGAGWCGRAVRLLTGIHFSVYLCNLDRGRRHGRDREGVRHGGRGRESGDRDDHPGGEVLRAARGARHRGREGRGHLGPAEGLGLRHARPRLREHGVVPQRDHVHRRREGRPPLPRVSHRGPRGALDVHRGRLPAAVRRAAHGGPARGVLDVPERELADPRGHAALLRGVPAGIAPHGDPRHHGRIAVHLLPDPRAARREGGAPDPGQPHLAGAHDRGDLLQGVHRRADRVPLVHAALRPELPDHDVLLAGEGLPHRRRHRARHRPVLHPARRPRAELLDLHGAHDRLEPRQCLRGHQRGHLGALGAAPRRGEPGGHHHAAADPRGRRRRHGVHPAGEGPQRDRPAHGVRPPGVQELRPAGRDIEGALPQAPEQAGHDATRCSTSPSASRRSP